MVVVVEGATVVVVVDVLDVEGVVDEDVVGTVAGRVVVVVVVAFTSIAPNRSACAAIHADRVRYPEFDKWIPSMM